MFTTRRITPCRMGEIKDSTFLSATKHTWTSKETIKARSEFGCVICGNPLIQIHYIIPWSQSHTHIPSEMIALCPTHHYRADMEEYRPTYLRELKQSPPNSIMVNDAFSTMTPDLEILLASVRMINAPRIITVDDFDVISIEKSGIIFH